MICEKWRLTRAAKEEVLFGSNFPMIAPGDCLAQLGELQLEAETQRLFLSDNAVRVFRLGR